MNYAILAEALKPVLVAFLESPDSVCVHQFAAKGALGLFRHDQSAVLTTFSYLCGLNHDLFGYFLSYMCS